MQKGFQVYLNDEALEPISLDILVPTDFNIESVPPYAYIGTYDEVDVQLFVGFYRKLATEAEIEDEQLAARSRDNAGWTVICNDRVVLHHDKSTLTGWGTDTVPKYHNQFIAIAGVVRFHSNHPLNLPLNTTKRGLDTSSPIYWHTLRFMREGLKKFTDFTNHWKGREEDTNPRFEVAIPRTATEVIGLIPEAAWKPIRGEEGRRFVPDLPRPAQANAKRRISFLRLIEEIEYLADYLFDNRKAPSGEVGARCFDDALERARGNKT